VAEIFKGAAVRAVVGFCCRIKFRGAAAPGMQALAEKMTAPLPKWLRTNFLKSALKGSTGTTGVPTAGAGTLLLAFAIREGRKLGEGR
jgi:hypothetical protein